MKKLLLSLLLISFSSLGFDLLEKAILESDLETFYYELNKKKKRIGSAPLFTPQQQLKYLDLSKEMITKTRNKIELIAALPGYNRMEMEELSSLGAAQGVFGITGMVMLPGFFMMISKGKQIEHGITALILLEILCGWMIYNFECERKEKKELREQKYENALKIRQLIFDHMSISS